MKRIFLLALLSGLLVSFAYPQNEAGVADDAARISLTPYISGNLNFNTEVSRQLLNKIKRMLTDNGLAGIENGRFILTANIDVLSEDIVTTTATFYQYELQVNFFVGDGIEGNLFASASQKVKGLGETKDDAYIKALKNIKPGNTAFKTMLEQGTQRILAYYNAQCDFIIKEAKAYAAQQDYDAAIFKLMSVPEVCSDCYTRCMDEAKIVFQAKIDLEGEAYYARAAALWAASPNNEGALEAGNWLAQINPASKAYEKGTVLFKTISERIKTLDQREWNLQLKRQQDAVDMKKAEIQAMRDIGVAYGNHQQPVTYNTSHWR